MFEATQDGLGRNAPIHSIHGSLLAVGELLRFVEFLIVIRFSFIFSLSVRRRFVLFNKILGQLLLFLLCL